MLSFIKCKRNTETIKPTQKFQKLEMKEQHFYQNMQYLIAKNQNLLKNKKWPDCWVS